MDQTCGEGGQECEGIAIYETIYAETELETKEVKLFFGHYTSFQDGIPPNNLFVEPAQIGPGVEPLPGADALPNISYARMLPNSGASGAIDIAFNAQVVDYDALETYFNDYQVIATYNGNGDLTWMIGSGQPRPALSTQTQTETQTDSGMCKLIQIRTTLVEKGRIQKAKT